MAGAKEDQLLGGYVYTILDKIEADMFQVTKRWSWKWIV